LDVLGDDGMTINESQIINLHYDDNACIWIATSHNGVGLTLESENILNLVNRVKSGLPEMLELNGLPHEDTRVLFNIQDKT